MEKGLKSTIEWEKSYSMYSLKMVFSPVLLLCSLIYCSQLGFTSQTFFCTGNKRSYFSSLLTKILVRYICHSLNICHFAILSVHREFPVYVFIALRCFTIGLCHDLFTQFLIQAISNLLLLQIMLQQTFLYMCHFHMLGLRDKSPRSRITGSKGRRTGGFRGQCQTVFHEERNSDATGGGKGELKQNLLYLSDFVLKGSTRILTKILIVVLFFLSSKLIEASFLLVLIS